MSARPGDVRAVRGERGEPLGDTLARLRRELSAYIVNPLTGRRVNFARLFMTHPPTEERIARLTAKGDDLDAQQARRA